MRDPNYFPWCPCCREYERKDHATKCLMGRLKADRDRLQRLLDSRPAINAGLPETYIAWSRQVYESDIWNASNIR